LKSGHRGELWTMEKRMLKANILSIVFTGILMAIMGVLLCFFRGFVARNIRFFLPVPPIGVAAYIFVFNMFKHYEGGLPGSRIDTLLEIALSTLVSAMVQLARRPEWQEKARAAGAKGLRVIANIETGQEMIQRWEMDDVFYGFTDNWIMQEAVLASGCVDLFACDKHPTGHHRNLIFGLRS